MSETVSRELRKLINQRNAVKSSVGIIIKYVEKFDHRSQSIKNIQTRSDRLLQLIQSFNEVQLNIIDLDEGHLDEEDRLKFEDETCTLKAAMDDLVSKFGVTETENSFRASHASTHDTVRLPTIQPPTFSGNLEDWSSFFDTFNALFHNNAALTDVQRLHYLKSSVLGSAADIIKNFSITSDNYHVAYNELIRHYENKSFTIQSHIRSLLNSPKIIVASADELRKLHHHVSSHVRALKALGQPVQHWDAWLVTLICGQLDSSTAGEWQLRQDSRELPTYDQIESFLAKRVFAFEAGACVPSHVNERSQRARGQQVNSKVLLSQSADVKVIKCSLCSAAHRIHSCDAFKKMSLSDRKNTVSKLRLCFNCLNYGHQVRDCKFPGCPQCGKRHNFQLHASLKTLVDQSAEKQLPSEEPVALYTEVIKSPSVQSFMNVMLATAIIHVNDRNGQPRPYRAVLDSGSQLNFVTDACAVELGLQPSNISCNIVGVDGMSSKSKVLSKTIVSSRFGECKRSVQFHSLPVIVNSLPSQTVNAFNDIPDFIRSRLADPQFYVPGPVDILIGTEIFFDVIGTEKWMLSDCASLRNTDFGWIVTGQLPVMSCIPVNSALLTTSDSSLSLFASKASRQIVEDRRAEEHFCSTVSRTKLGRFVVRLPFTQHPQVLGDSRQIAQKRFLNLEKRLVKEPSLAEQYRAFISEYISLGHMELAEFSHDGPVYYLPHHAVIKSESVTTKLRVVFDGSATTSSGLSLNDILMKGPKSQPDLISILLRFRIHRIAITADVAKMYRQVLVAEEDQDLQRILYRSDPQEQLKDYRLKTVTYGTRCASFLATRCLSQIAVDVDDPAIKRVILNDFYVDDLLSGGDSVDQLHHVYQKLHSTLNQYGFPLRKWCSSSPQLMSLMPLAHDDLNFVVKLSEEDTVSALGLLWQPSSDCFKFIVKEWHPPLRMTKRTLLSDINSVYDPVGLISPVLIKGKIFVQQMWALKVGWDELLPIDYQSRWIRFYLSLKSLVQLSIPRRITSDSFCKIEIHGFCDASQEAFGASIYVRSITSDGHVSVYLYTSKSRVAPLRATTIPRLELCGALLLTELMDDVRRELEVLNIKMESSELYYWCDSTIVLAWIGSESLFQVYISNRIARIRDMTSPAQWHHVPSKDNPSDLITRGVDATSMSNCESWWHGPHWLSKDESNWPDLPHLPEELPEVRTVKLALVTVEDESRWILKKYSSWITLVRVTALVRRFVNNCKCSMSNQNEKCIVGFINVHELADAERFWLADAQSHAFNEELAYLKAGRLVRRGSALTSLSPFVDNHGLIRVGGRLANAHVQYNQKHPIVLPSRDLVTELIFRYEHCRLLHLGPQSLLAHISIKFWPLRGRLIARKTVRKCLQCFRARPKFSSPFMAPLPHVRVNVERVFSQTGVDYCGPIMIKSGRRKVSPTKGYICVFVCMVTRAVHLELVSSLSAEDFIATLTRFMARRGQCAKLFSDNGTNFVGAHRILQTQFREYSKSKLVNDYLSCRTIEWHFIPPAAPHFGGLWEAAVQSAKRHLLRVTKGVLFTYDETTTLLCRVEAALNSRPLTPLSSDPADFSVLTPGHFLVGEPLMLPPERDVSDVPLNRLRRFKLMQACMQVFWKRWSLEYLPQIQRRGKWTKMCRNAAVGDLAVLREDNVPPMKWSLVRIIKIHPGADGVVRAVTIRNSLGMEFRRPSIKLALIPNDEDDINIPDAPVSS